MNRRRYELRARISSYSTVTLRVEAIDKIDAQRQAYRELFGDDEGEVAWVSIEELAQTVPPAPVPVIRPAIGSK